MPKTFTNTQLPASDLNSFMLQPGTAGTGTRLVAGTQAISFSSSSAASGTISYGFTFGGAPKVIGVVQIGSNFDVALNWTSTPGTTSVGYRAFQVAGTAITGSGTIFWIAVGPA